MRWPAPPATGMPGWPAPNSACAWWGWPRAGA
ncbi:Uncharacterised protein [Bordetella pertussis]|nr:Uncharacterised protein [Bordetella pertussis]